MSGFERIPHNGSEQLCINAANERLQKFFNETVFLMEKADYEAEGITMANLDFRDNQPVIDLLFKVQYAGRDSERGGQGPRTTSGKSQVTPL